MNWGKGITITIILFVSFMLFLVITCIRQPDINLVAKDYYEQEIRYQEVIDKKNNATQLTNKPQLKLNNQNLEIDFSDIEDVKLISGNIQFFRPSDPLLDKTIVLKIDSAGIQHIPLNQLSKGKWIVKLNWSNLSTDFLIEESIIIP